MLDTVRDNIDSLHCAANRSGQHNDNTASGDGGPGLSDTTGHLLHTV
ncbi:hypothetical protein BH23ACT4_BH23ACT4_05690 [soil metagenome]